MRKTLCLIALSTIFFLNPHRITAQGTPSIDQVKEKMKNHINALIANTSDSMESSPKNPISGSEGLTLTYPFIQDHPVYKNKIFAINKLPFPVVEFSTPSAPTPSAPTPSAPTPSASAPPPTPGPVPILVEEGYKKYNIVKIGSLYVGVSQLEGPQDLTNLADFKPKFSFFKEASHDLVREKIDDCPRSDCPRPMTFLEKVAAQICKAP